MNLHQAQHEFKRLLAQQGLSLTARPVDQIGKAILGFYRSRHVDESDVSAKGEMLLDQWELLDSDEHGRWFSQLLCIAFGRFWCTSPSK